MSLIKTHSETNSKALLMDHGFRQKVYFPFFMMISMQSSTMEQRCAMELFTF